MVFLSFEKGRESCHVSRVVARKISECRFLSCAFFGKKSARQKICADSPAGTVYSL
jgi:hypothetical protein